MENMANFVYGPYGNAQNADNARALRVYHDKLVNMRDMVLYQMDHKKITQANIDMLERELSEIIGSIDKMLRISNIDEFFPSLRQIQFHIRRARKCLHMISMLREKPYALRSMDLLLEKFEEFPDCLLDAINLFII